MCSANPWIFGVVWHWSFYPRLINVQIQTPINPKSLGMDVVAGNCAVPAEGAFGTFPQHSQHPNPALAVTPAFPSTFPLPLGKM